ncbi:hypothetical protein C6P40_005421, partial [Pichia californica]
SITSDSISKTTNSISSDNTAAATTTATENILTETDTEQTLVTITSCSDNKCSLITGIQSLATTLVNDHLTVYTTYCPLSDKSTIYNYSETTVTITSCSDNKCSLITGVQSLVTTLIDNQLTVYTTYCPLSRSNNESFDVATVDETAATGETIATVSKSTLITIHTYESITLTTTNSASVTVSSEPVITTSVYT